VNPLTVWFYEECYILFAVDDYKNGNLGQNKFSHLTNHSIAKTQIKKDEKIPYNMWSQSMLKDHLQQKQG